MELLQGFAISTSEKAKQHQESILIQNIVLTLLAVVIGLIYTGLVSRKISKPLVALNQQVFHTIHQQQLHKLSVRSSDEVGVLTDHFNLALSSLQRSEKLKDMFGQYQDPCLISHTETGSDAFKLDGEKQAVTVLLTSLDNLSWTQKSSEQIASVKGIDARDMISIVNDYLKVQTADTGKFKGIVNFTHTEILTFWCHPFPTSDKHIQRACQSMLAQLQGVERFKESLKARYPDLSDIHDIQIRAGLTCGDLVLTNMGPAGARSFTVIGDEVNGASHLQSVARHF